MDKRDQRKLERQLQGESRWLQKTLFALGKAREAREKLSETKGKKLDPLIALKDGTTISLDALEEVIQERVTQLREALGQGIYGAGG